MDNLGTVCDVRTYMHKARKYDKGDKLKNQGNIMPENAFYGAKMLHLTTLINVFLCRGLALPQLSVRQMKIRDISYNFAVFAADLRHLN